MHRVYRPPNSPTGLFSHLENLIAKLDLTNIEFFPLGDMNADMALACEQAPGLEEHNGAKQGKGNLHASC